VTPPKKRKASKPRTRAPAAPAVPVYSGLTPDVVLDAVESVGYRCDGRQSALNSFENRVFQVWLEDGAALVAKFYRPGRWTDASIDEEHAFAAELVEREIPVVAPLAGDGGRTLHAHAGFRFALYPKRPGRTPELEHEDVLQWLGRFLARIHVVGRRCDFKERPLLSPDTFGYDSLDYLLDKGNLPPELRDAYAAIGDQVLAAVGDRFEQAQGVEWIRTHGDCHAGNMLWTEGGPHFVDLDDCCTAPAVQDLWMLLPGDRPTATRALSAVLRGYREFSDFDTRELLLIEPLRALRMLHYSAWLARRWDDPAFPAAFPWFGTERYWQEQILALREQLAALAEPPLAAAW
jgi:Ser/Thr protein kinase RdoA (MazF antagonist)